MPCKGNSNEYPQLVFMEKSETYLPDISSYLELYFSAFAAAKSGLTPSQAFADNGDLTKREYSRTGGPGPIFPVLNIGYCRLIYCIKSSAARY